MDEECQTLPSPPTATVQHERWAAAGVRGTLGEWAMTSEPARGSVDAQGREPTRPLRYRSARRYDRTGRRAAANARSTRGLRTDTWPYFLGVTVRPNLLPVCRPAGSDAPESRRRRHLLTGSPLATSAPRSCPQVCVGSSADMTDMTDMTVGLQIAVRAAALSTRSPSSLYNLSFNILPTIMPLPCTPRRPTALDP